MDIAVSALSGGHRLGRGLSRDGDRAFPEVGNAWGCPGGDALQGIVPRT
jgi:hypothetical protein